MRVLALWLAWIAVAWSATLTAANPWELLWERQHEEAGYGMLGISNASGRLIAGTCFLPPRVAEVIALRDDGNPIWTHTGHTLAVAAAREADFFALLSIDGSLGATLSAFHADSPWPIWSHVLEPRPCIEPPFLCRNYGVRVADDGRTVVAFTPSGRGVRLLAFEGTGAGPIVDWDAPGGDLVDVDLTPDGRFLAFAAIPWVHVWDLREAELRWSSEAEVWCRAAIAAQGEYLAMSASRTVLLEWDGARYAPRWELPELPNHWYGDLAFSGEPALLVTRAWFGGAALELRDAGTSSLLWHHERYGPAHFDFEHCRFSPDETLIAARLTRDHAKPTLFVFSRERSSPLLVDALPGPSTDIELGAGGFVAVSGINAYDWQNTPGGFLRCYALERRPAHRDQPDLSARPNPFNPRTTLRFTLSAPGDYRLSIHDAAGRRVHAHAGSGPAGEQAYVWDAGGLASGIYVVRLETGRRVASLRVTLMK